jgi:hydrogenase 3 maturation protease
MKLGSLPEKLRKLRPRTPRMPKFFKKKEEKPASPKNDEYKEIRGMIRDRRRPEEKAWHTDLERIFHDYERIKKEEAEKQTRIAVVGIGNDLKGDDGAGWEVVRRLERLYPSDPNFLFIRTGTPEDHVRQIALFYPSTIILIDSAEFRGRPGEIRTIKEEDIQKIFFSTHTTPLTIFIKLIRAEVPTPRIIVVGIQRKTSGFGAPLSAPARESAGRLAKLISDLYKKKRMAGLEDEIACISHPVAGEINKIRKRVKEKMLEEESRPRPKPLFGPKKKV